MPNPTRAEVEAQWLNAATILNESEAYGSRNATNFLDLENTFIESLEGDYSDEALNAIRRVRGSLAGMVSQATARAVLLPFLRSYCFHVIGYGNANRASATTLLGEMRKYFIDQSRFVQSRVASFGTPTAVGTVGDVQILRLTKDEYNFDIEAFWADKKRAICIADHNLGVSKGAETWQIEGQTRARDELKRSGSSLSTTLSGLTTADSILSNAGFQDADSYTSPTSITDWNSTATINDTNFGFDSSNTFRKGPNDGATTYSLNVKASTTLYQKLSDIGQSLNEAVPYATAVVWNRVPGAGNGTLNIRMGNVSSGDISIAAQTGWNVSFCPPTREWAHWYNTFKEDDLRMDVQWTKSSGNLLLAEVLLVPGTLFDNHWYWVMPANTLDYTAPLIDEEFSITDTISDSSIIQKWLWRAWDFYLPHSNGSSISWIGS